MQYEKLFSFLNGNRAGEDRYMPVYINVLLGEYDGIPKVHIVSVPHVEP